MASGRLAETPATAIPWHGRKSAVSARLAGRVTPELRQTAPPAQPPVSGDVAPRADDDVM